MAEKATKRRFTYTVDIDLTSEARIGADQRLWKALALEATEIAGIYRDSGVRLHGVTGGETAAEVQ